MTTTNGSSVREQNYHRALQASPEIQALDTMVRLIALLGPPGGDKPMCHGCFWRRRSSRCPPTPSGVFFAASPKKRVPATFPQIISLRGVEERKGHG
jgi:hypothetical protein